MPEPTFLDTADHIGARLCRDAIWAGNCCNWLGWALEPIGNSWTPVYRAQGGALYDGTAGIALFLGRLHAFTRDALQKTTAMGALNQAFARIADLPRGIEPSFYSGATGIGYAAIDLGKSISDERMIARGMEVLLTASEIPSDPAWLDVLGGSAGTIQVLLEAADRMDNRDLIERAVAHGQVLLRTAKATDEGWSWDTLPGQTQKNLTGYGHGAGGIGCALLQLWSHTGDSHYRNAGLEAFRYERSLFSAEQHNWPDLRSMNSYANSKNQPVFSVAWCHGAPGIGLSRLAAAGIMSDPSILNELDEALLTTVAACSNVSFPRSGNLCLCHGLGGNAELLLNASCLLPRRNLREIAENIGHQAIAQLRRDDLPWPCGVNGAGETPNLMLGLAGIGHFFLRLYDVERIPSVLLLEANKARYAEAHTQVVREPALVS